ncbi:hypothetical protein [Azonexus sp.]|uniref:hypothetical protein n=1 Tax=Azonexus sp. TaxID=1872668 RepID=UPI0039E43300
MSEALYTTKKEIAKRIEVLRMEISFLESINTGCASCDAFDGRGCKRAGGVEPPPEVKAQGCPEWKWDEIPF